LTVSKMDFNDLKAKRLQAVGSLKAFA